MELCSDGHSEICYDCKRCPVCEKLTEISDLEDDNFELKEKLAESENKINFLEEQLSRTEN